MALNTLAKVGIGVASPFLAALALKGFRAVDPFAPSESELERQQAAEKKADAAADKIAKREEQDRAIQLAQINRGNALLEAYLGNVGASTQAQIELQRDLVKAATDPDLLRESEGIRTQNKLEQIAAYQRGQMEQTRELTRRQIESDTIKAWQGITQAEINRDTAMGLGMMQIAYQSSMPNPNTLTAAANFAAQGRAGFTAPKSPI
jgi:hypothetical protein